MDTVNIILKDGIFLRQTISHREIGPFDQVVGAAVGRQPFCLRNAARVTVPTESEYLTNSDYVTHGLPVVITYAHNMAYTSVILPYLPLEGTFRVNENEYQFEGYSEGALRRAIVETASKGFLVVFVNVTPYNMERSNPLSAAPTSSVRQYLLAYNPNNCKVHRPNYPNIFDDGKICMGSAYNPSIASLVGSLQHSLNHFFEARANADLSTSHVDAFLRFRQYEPDGPLTHCPSNNIYSTPIDTQTCLSVYNTIKT